MYMWERTTPSGVLLQGMRLSRGMFGARATVAVRVHLAKMKLKPRLAEELGARGATKSGRQRALQLRLRALIIRGAGSRDFTFRSQVAVGVDGQPDAPHYACRIIANST